MAKVQHTCTGCVPIDASIIDVYVTLVQTNQFVTDAETGRALAEAARVTAENARTATFSEDHSRAVADHTNAQTAINNANAAAAAANAAGITSASASVDSNVGTPSVDVSLVNKQLSLSFHNIKGEKGEKGDRGDGAIPVVNDLVTGGTAAALSAEMGKTLNTTKQATLVSGTNIKTVNGESLLGEGNIIAGDPNAVKYVAQTLTDAQKAQARTNIDSYQKPSTGIPATDLASAAQTSLGKADTAYQKPSGGIPKTDLDSGVQGSLDLADSAIQARPMGEVDPTITPADYATTEELSELEAKVDELEFKDINVGKLTPAIVANEYVHNNTGAFVPYNGWSRTDYINIHPFSKVKITATHATLYCAKYDANFQKTNGITLANGSIVIDVLENEYYLAVSDSTQYIASIQFEIAEYRVDVVNKTVNAIEAKVDDFNGITTIENGSTGNTGNTQLVRTKVLGRNGARYAIVRITRPNATGCHYAIGYAFTSSKDDIGSASAYANWNGPVSKTDVNSTRTNLVVDMVNFPSVVGVAITIGEYDSDGNAQTLRKGDFAGYEVSIICDGRAEEVYKTESSLVLNEVNLLGLPNVDGYVDGTGAANTNASWKTAYIERTLFGDDMVIIGRVDFVHFYDVNKTWMSCFASWASTKGAIRLKKSDIPIGCVYVAISFPVSENTFIHLYDTRSYIDRKKGLPFSPFFRGGGIRYSANSPGVSTALVIPTYKASAIRVTINKDAGEGYHYNIFAALYPTISDEISVTVNLAYSTGPSIDGNTLYIRTEGIDGVGFQVEKLDGNGTQQTLAKDYFSESDVTVERIFVPDELLGMLNYDAYTRNRDKDAMLSSAVRVNKTANGSMDFLSLVITDSHSDSVAELNAVNIANGFQYVQALLHLGDFCASTAGNFNSDVYDKMIACKKPFYFVCGNHDVGNSKTISDCITTSQFYTRYIDPLVSAGLLESGEYTEGEGYYYHDFAEKKIRLVCIYEYDGPDDVNPNDNTKYTYRHGDSIISKAQAQWFCGVLNSTPADYGIIVAMHNPFSAFANCVTTAKFNDPAWVDGYGAQRLFTTDLWADIVDAWVNKSANYHCSMVCKGDASYLNVDGEYYSFDYDFSGRNNTAKFLCFIGGHVHRDCVWRHRTYRYQYQITPICANTTNYAQCPDADIRRTPTDGPSKDSLTAIGYDKDNQAIRLVKLGVNVTENMVARDYELIKTQEL